MSGGSRRASGWVRSWTVGVVVAALSTAAPGCTSLVRRTGIALYYREAEHPLEHLRLDVQYAADNDPKHALDLFVPDPSPGGDAPGVPTLVFVHGGGFTEGDRALEVGGADIYRNIGRFFASRGIATAVISYRLQPEATWLEQLDDVGEAVRWVHDHARDWGGDPDSIFLSGHSAGAYLSARYALDEPARRASGAEVCGLVLVSGAAYDILDEETYALGARREWFEERFSDGGEGWKTRASVVPLVARDSVPALILYATGEPAKLTRQSALLADAYARAGARVTTVRVPGEDHQRIVLTLSRADKTAGPAILDFIESTPCGVVERRASAGPPATRARAAR